MSTTPQKPFLEFFAGIGLVHQGLRAGGWRCAYANDIDAKKRMMYESAFGESAYYHLGDVWGTEEVVSRIDEPPVLATASFPCTDLSTAGRYEGLAGKHSSAFFAFRDVLAALAEAGRQPPMVMIENVPGLLTSRGGADFTVACEALAGLGYFLDTLIVDARHFVPQSRPRLFIIGTVVPAADQLEPAESAALFGGASVASCPARPARLVEAIARTPLSTGWIHHRLGSLPTPTTLLADILDADDAQPWWPAEQLARHMEMISELHQGRLAEIRRDGRPWISTAFRRIRKGRMMCELRFDGVAGCLRTPKGGSARQIVIAVAGDRTRMRWMTPREYARLQGAGDFPLTVPDSQAMFGFGDAVCVPVIEWIDREILTPAASRVVNHDGCVRTQETL